MIMMDVEICCGITYQWEGVVVWGLVPVLRKSSRGGRGSKQYQGCCRAVRLSNTASRACGQQAGAAPSLRQVGCLLAFSRLLAIRSV
jgi:hypothetical protein